ncbi:adhesin [Paractinoplanes toevensis]|uniref:adhesin n=1 Tax=Paractinoplanes toevensis TaxID=571911 RepID=UPI001FEA12A0|nr:adhesin [Actinoplanes toevensis]
MSVVPLVRVYGGPIMRTTVGSLPPAVYWRRRAVVLGAVLLGIIVLFVSCSGDDKDDQRGKGASPSSQLPTPAPATDSGSPSTEPTFLDGVPGGNGPSLPALGDLESKTPGVDDGSGSGSADNGQNTNVTVPADGSCADTEMTVVPAASPTTFKRGATVELSLTVKNTGTRTCSRDVGAGPQELYIDSGGRQYWSSDKCSDQKGSDVRQFAPGDARTYKVSWNGRQSSSCAGNAASGPTPPQGQFDLRARLGTLRSEPIVLTILAS